MKSLIFFIITSWVLTNHSIVMAQSTFTWTLSGRITNTKTGNGIDSANVIANWSTLFIPYIVTSFSIFTDSAGYYNSVSEPPIDIGYEENEWTMLVTIFKKGFHTLRIDTTFNLPKGNFALIADSTTDIQEQNLFKSIIFPNPATDYIEINYPLDCDNIRIFNALGEIVLNTKSIIPLDERIRIDISSLSPGLYLVQTGNKINRFIKI